MVLLRRKRSTNRMSVRVLQRDIEGSQPRTRNLCMVHRAIKRTFPDSTHVSVTREQVKFCLQSERMRYVLLMPASAAAHIEEFDNTGTCKPFRIHFHDIYKAPMEKYRSNKPGSGPSQPAKKKKKKDDCTSRVLWDPTARWAGGRVARVA